MTSETRQLMAGTYKCLQKHDRWLAGSEKRAAEVPRHDDVVGDAGVCHRHPGVVHITEVNKISMSSHSKQAIDIDSKR